MGNNPLRTETVAQLGSIIHSFKTDVDLFTYEVEILLE